MDEFDPLESSADEGETRTLSVLPAHIGERADKVLASLLPEFSRSYLQQRIEAGSVKCGPLAALQPLKKPSQRIKVGEALSVDLVPTAQSQAYLPQNLPIETIYLDEHLRVVNKAPGMVVHPAPGNWQGTLLNGLLALDPQAVNLPRAGIVHRLDKDTSGLMVVARTRAAMDALVKAIAARDVHREYMALAHRHWSGPSTRRVNAPIGRDVRNRLRMAVVDLANQAGKTANTDFTLLANHAEACWVHAKLGTGRTHQIRVHMAHLNHPLLGDAVYGGSMAWGMARQALHAKRLGFVHPMTGESMQWECELPADMKASLQQLGMLTSD